MDQIFAPWRIEWVKRDPPENDTGCVFCSMASDENDRRNGVLARSAHSFVILNNYPYNPGHVMIIPYSHTGDGVSLSEEELLDRSKLRQRTIRALRTAFDPDGFNVGINMGQAAGGSIRDHIHTHVVPRWNGDTNFMPVISETKVIVEGLAHSYERIHEAFSAQDRVRLENTDRAVEIQDP